MRFAAILLSTLLASCLSIQAHAIEPGDIAVPSMNVPNMNMPEPLITKPNMNVPVPNPKPLVEQNQAASQTDNLSSNQTEVAQIPQEVKPMDVSGKWSVRFIDRTDLSLDLTLWSSGKSQIMGYGTLKDRGAKHSVTASGSWAEQELILVSKSASNEDVNQKYDECDLDLYLANNTLSGTYILKLGGQQLGKGNATAAKL
jgi:hypothetical protein